MYKEVFKVDVSDYVKRRNRLRDNPEKSYTLILVHFTELTCMQLKVIPDWEATYEVSDAIKLLKLSGA